METPTFSNRDSESSDPLKHTTGISASTPVSLCKRSFPEITEKPEIECRHATKQIQDAFELSKRRRLSPQSLNMSTNMKHKAVLLTPPSSATEPVIRTMRLKIEIPEREPTKDEQRTLKIRKAAAKRWESKLQRPLPTKSEIKSAYPCKLLRHYTDPSSPVASNIVKPTIARSPRVDKLREAFPLLPTCTETMDSTVYQHGFPTPKEYTAPEVEERAILEEQLRQNKRITRSEYVQKQAWRAFSSREKDRLDRGRHAMMRSGLFEGDLDLESMGKANGLPEWRKARTSRFAEERLAE